MDKMRYLFFVALLLVIAVVLLSPNAQQLGDGYWYDRDGKRIFGPAEVIDIPPTASIVENSRNYILVRQIPKQEREEAIYEHDYQYPFGRDTTYYWIVFKKRHTSLGPLLQADLDSVLLSNLYEDGPTTSY